MSDVTVKRLDECSAYDGPHAIPGITFRPAGKDLGVTAWGMSLMELEPDCTGYPEHDHASDGQEEVYVVLGGSATLVAGDDEWRVEKGAIVRVGPDTKRKFVTGSDGLTLLALGGVPKTD